MKLSSMKVVALPSQNLPVTLSGHRMLLDAFSSLVQQFQLNVPFLSLQHYFKSESATPVWGLTMPDEMLTTSVVPLARVT